MAGPVYIERLSIIIMFKLILGNDDFFANFQENGENTPEFFDKVDPSGEMNLFSPTKPQNSVSTTIDTTIRRYTCTIMDS